MYFGFEIERKEATTRQKVVPVVFSGGRILVSLTKDSKIP
jgi:hypothetical protein